MSNVENKRRRQEDAMVRDVLKSGPHLDRRKFFVSAGAFAAAAAGAGAGTVAAPRPAMAEMPRVLRKPDDRLLNIGATVRSGNYWDFSTWITPVEEFYVRNHYPTPTASRGRPNSRAENWKMRSTATDVIICSRSTYEDLLKMPGARSSRPCSAHGLCRVYLFSGMQGFTAAKRSPAAPGSMGASACCNRAMCASATILDIVGCVTTR